MLDMGPRELVKHHEEAEVCQESAIVYVCLVNSIYLEGRRVFYCQWNRAYNEDVGGPQKKLFMYQVLYCVFYLSVLWLCAEFY